ncbi:hypothetical protein [Ensifer sp. ENS12]|uniref:hypothetical protein n=1 Tax=Ensifer sp. ENS12 TaxID=2854774 RepID=UPI0013AFDD25|nr:hypothetical protein [Ensifer sp. ENS12]MBV7522569.1 hypothetical protein [Ensifer sp. ENS12]
MGWIFMAMLPVNDVGCRLRHRPGQPLEDFGAVRDHGDVTETAISFAPKSMKGAIPDCGSVGAGDKIAATGFAPTAAAASGHNEFEASRRIGIGTADMSRVDADDEVFASVAGKMHFELAPFISFMRPCPPFFLCNLIV